MQIVYSTELVAHLKGSEFKNPRHFLAPVEGATKVFIAGDWPKIRQAYEAVGVPVAPIEDMRALPKAAKSTSAKKPAKKPAADAPPPAATATDNSTT